MTAYKDIKRLVDTQPELRGAWNAGLSAITPMIDRWSTLKQQVAQTAKPTQTDVSGIAGAGQPKAKRLKNIRVERFQKQYNQVRKQLVENRIISKQKVMQKYPWLKPDGIRGRRTIGAEKVFAEMQKMLQGGKPAISPARQSVELPPADKPVERSRERPGQSFDAAQAQAGKIWRALLQAGRSEGASSADINSWVSTYMDQGMSPEEAGKKVMKALRI